MDLKSYIAVFVFTLFGGAITTGISYTNGYNPCQIFGFCESELLLENQKLLAEVSLLQLELKRIDAAVDANIGNLTQSLETERKLNNDIVAIVQDIGKINRKGARTSENIREIAKKIVDIAHLLDPSDPN